VNLQEEQDIPKALFGYDITARLGLGAASVIYAAKDPKDGKAYALKHVMRRDDKDDRFIAQLQNEFKVMQDVRHP